MADASHLARLQAQFMRAMASASEVVDAAAFRIFIWPGGDLFYRNVAVPVAPAADWRDAIGAMQAVFARAGRTPRLEFFEELWPALPAALERQGFVREMRAPAMTLTRHELSPAAMASADEPRPRLLSAAAGDLELATFLTFQARIFQGESYAATAEDVRQLRLALGRGATLAAAIMEDGRPIAVGSLVGVGRDAELAGIATAPARRRAGLAEQVCRTLLDRFFAGPGELVWLSAGGPGSDRLYRKLGFATAGTQLNYGLPVSVRAA
jgi:ribosomal protein S18 acetylase RimI-like enzyme